METCTFRIAKGKAVSLCGAEPHSGQYSFSKGLAFWLPLLRSRLPKLQVAFSDCLSLFAHDAVCFSLTTLQTAFQLSQRCRSFTEPVKSARVS